MWTKVFLKLRDEPASLYQVLGLKIRITTTQFLKLKSINVIYNINKLKVITWSSNEILKNHLTNSTTLHDKCIEVIKNTRDIPKHNKAY